LWDKYVHGTNMARDYYNLSAGVRKKFWNGNASVSLKFNDILRTSNAFYKTDYLNQYLKYTVLNEKQYVRLSFRYNFGNSKLSDNDKDVDNSERDRL
jgi:hypothetical protein